MKVLCACAEYLIDPERSTYVRNFMPMCHEYTCKRVQLRRALAQIAIQLDELKIERQLKLPL